MTRPSGRAWSQWWRVGCGVESLHDLLTSRGIAVSLDEVLTRAVDRDGYLDDVGWRHHALVAVAAEHAIVGAVCPPLTGDDIAQAPSGSDWIISVRAPEQFGTMTHLVHVRGAGAAGPSEGTIGHVEIFWPQGHLKFGERFSAPTEWLAARMTGRGMRFDPPAAG